MSTQGARLREERDRLGLSQIEFAERGGVGKHSQINYENDRRHPDSKYLVSIEKIGVDVMYVLTGTREEETIARLHAEAHEEVLAEMGRSEREAFALSQVGEDVGQRHAENQPVHQDGEAVELSKFSLVSLFDIGLSAGPGLVPIKDAEVGHIAVSRHWLRQHNLSAKNCAMVRVCGDSMSPTVPDGSWVLIDAAETQVVREGVFAFSREGEAFIKRFVPVEGGETGSPNALVIVSDNPAIPPETVAGQELNTLRVVGRVRSVLTDL
ncbi:S24 family peptidase [Pseudophaeobacter sp.]|uniref:XRE family transcriptional regulator n=1 Tax=Pseudophaeobacter sp. TaxID=1971739 RepID=UPI0032999917